MAQIAKKQLDARERRARKFCTQVNPMKTRSVTCILVVLFLAAFATAQNTRYSTKLFSATFAGPVTTPDTTSRTTTNTSSNQYFNASSPGIQQMVAIRTIDAPGIDVNQASIDFYAAQSVKGKVQDERRDGSIQGHPSVYTNSHYTDDLGILTRRRVKHIILNSRTVLILFQEGAASNDDGGGKAWETLVNSLVINEKTCWLPEGCN